MSDQKAKGTILVILTAFISGFAIFINKLGVKGIDPYFYTFAKNIIAGGFLVSVLLLAKNYRDVLKLDRTDKIRLLAIAVLGGAIPFLLFFKGLTLTSAFQASFIHKTLFIYVGILAVVFLREKISKSMLFGFASLILGSFLFLKIKPQALNLGGLYIFAAVLLWSAEIVISKKALKNLSGTLVGSARLFLGSLFILLFLLATGRADMFGGINLNVLTWMLIGGVILAGYNWTFYSGLKHIKASEATAVLTLGVPITGILTAIFLDQSLSGQELAGAGLIILGVILASEIVSRFSGAILGVNKILGRKKLNEWS